MFDLKRRRWQRVLGVLCVLSLVASMVVAGTAVAKPGAGKKQPPVAAEPGWPDSHQPDNDPKPGQAGFMAASVPAPPLEEGMTDEQLMAADPLGYAQMKAERDVIERSLLAKTRSQLKAAGITPASDGAMDASGAASASAVLASSAVSPYGYLRFTLTRNTTSQWARAGYLGMLYFTYGVYQPTVDSYRWYTVSWPARSGDNVPSHQSWVGVGPIPAYTYDFGFMYGAYRGYEPDGRVEFSPGKWRLDPWTGAPFGRSCLEVHGGIGTHEFGATSGCVRIHPSSINSLRSYWTYKMANKYDRNTAHLIVRY